MEILRICLAQINSTVGDLEGNCSKILQRINDAKKSKADIVVFPELALSGYPPEDLLQKPHFIKKNREYLGKIINNSADIFVIVGFPGAQKDKIYNSAALIYNKKLLGVYHKICLPNYGVFDEQRYFASGTECPVYNFNGKFKTGINICEDIWHQQGPQKIQSLYGKAKIIINISSSPYHIQKLDLREKLLKNMAVENNTHVFYCNAAGAQDELVFDGGSMVFDNKGKLTARAKQFEEDMLYTDLVIDKALSGKTAVKNKSVLNINVKGFKTKPKEINENVINKKYGLIEEVYNALVLGFRDYVSKNGFKKIVLGLSGGIDSALVAALAVYALGKENVVALTLPSRYSSEGTLNDAKCLAINLGIKLYEIPIKKLHDVYLDLFKDVFKGTKPNITEENIQARIRGNILMAFSNKFGWLVVTTGNKSELSVGYCTLYGDTAGGFALIKDVPKTLVYRLSEFINQKNGRELIPVSIFKRAPTAELKNNQTDQDTLPPYNVLDKIIDEYVENDRSMAQIVKKGFNRETVSRVISMIDKNEYKRRQSPIGIKITPKAFGRDRRMPITNKFDE
ncbi:MAG: NAD+ synthase [Elusimicrobia bacterium RIFOXYA2_FULL_39_19]|nr:MAG: NAD+ synthase [Elusimicrobia bacterium RIFOXYA2_FULL_39_19]